MRLRCGAVVAAVVGSVVGLAACSSDEPSLDEIGSRLEQDAPVVVDHLANTNTDDPGAVEVVSDGSEDVSCDDGAKREFEATFPMRDGEPDSNLDLFNNAVFAAFNTTEDPEYYTVSEDGRPDDKGSERTWRATNEDETITFEIRAAGKPGSEVVITGETSCAAD